MKDKYSYKDAEATSTVGRASKLLDDSLNDDLSSFQQDGIHLYHGNVLDFYDNWDTPNIIISDGAY